MVGTSGDSRSASMPAMASASRSQSSACRFSSPVPDAIEWSTAQAPVTRAITSSLIPAQRRTAAKVAGSFSANHRSLVSGAIGCSGVPVRSCSSGCSRRRRSACSVARMSAHVINGVNARPPPSRPTSECIAPLNDRATIRAPLVAGRGRGRADRRRASPRPSRRDPGRPGRARARAAGRPSRRGPGRGRRRRRRPPWRWSSRCRRRGRRSPGRSRSRSMPPGWLRVSRAVTAGADGWRHPRGGVQSLGSWFLGRETTCPSRWRPTSRRRSPSPTRCPDALALAEIRDEVRAQRAEARRIYSAFAFLAAGALIIALANLVAVAVSSTARRRTPSPSPRPS